MVYYPSILGIYLVHYIILSYKLIYVWQGKSVHHHHHHSQCVSVRNIHKSDLVKGTNYNL